MAASAVWNRPRESSSTLSKDLLIASRREHIGHALRTLGNQCDRCERMLTDAGQGLAELGEALVRDHDQRAS